MTKTSKPEAISLLLTSAIHQPLINGTLKLQSATCIRLDRLVLKSNASGPLVKNSSKKEKVSAVHQYSLLIIQISWLAKNLILILPVSAHANGTKLVCPLAQLLLDLDQILAQLQPGTQKHANTIAMLQPELAQIQMTSTLIYQLTLPSSIAYLPI